MQGWIEIICINNISIAVLELCLLQLIKQIPNDKSNKSNKYQMTNTEISWIGPQNFKDTLGSYHDLRWKNHGLITRVTLTFTMVWLKYLSLILWQRMPIHSMGKYLKNFPFQQESRKYLTEEDSLRQIEESKWATFTRILSRLLGHVFLYWQ